MVELMSRDEYNVLFEKFILSMRDQLFDKFTEFVKNSEERTSIPEKVTEEVQKKRGRPKKDTTNEENKSNGVKKRGRGRPKKTESEQLLVTVVNDTDDDDAKKRGRPLLQERDIDRKVYEIELTEDVIEETGVEEIDVVRVEINGKLYLRDGKNKLYNMDDQEFVGMYDDICNV